MKNTQTLMNSSQVLSGYNTNVRQRERLAIAAKATFIGDRNFVCRICTAICGNSAYIASRGKKVKLSYRRFWMADASMAKNHLNPEASAKLVSIRLRDENRCRGLGTILPCVCPGFRASPGKQSAGFPVPLILRNIWSC